MIPSSFIFLRLETTGLLETPSDSAIDTIDALGLLRITPMIPSTSSDPGFLLKSTVTLTASGLCNSSITGILRP